jgi:NNP family nitrate/nitrite transporter-like MFS transporter
MSDRFGARPVMQWVLISCLVCCGLLVMPRMDIWAPGSGVMARSTGVVKEVGKDFIVVAAAAGDVRYAFEPQAEASTEEQQRASAVVVLPQSASYQEPVVKAGDSVGKKQLLARGVTHIFFQANVWIFTFLVFIVGIAMGIGKAAVYRHIPDYFPSDVGVVGGMVGVLGGLGGFFCPIIFGYLLELTGLWTTCWMFFFALTAVCLSWMHIVIRRRMKAEAPAMLRQMEEESFSPIAEEA